MNDQMKIINSPIDQGETKDLERDDMETWIAGEGRLTSPNGAATMRYEGEYLLYPFRRGWRDNDNVGLDVWGPDALDGEIKMSPREAFRLGLTLIAHAEAEMRGV